MPRRLTNETHFRGLPVSGGLAFAKTCLFRQGRRDPPPDYRVSGEGIERERDRLRQAVASVIQHVEGLKAVVAERVGPAEAEIFAVQRAILEDPVLDSRLSDAIDSGWSAETAVLRTLEDYEGRVMAVENDYVRERASDISEIKQRLLETLSGTGRGFQCAGEPKCQRGRQRIVITQELTPASALDLDTDEIVGIVTARGGVTSHAAILARALGIPAVSGVEHVHDLVACGTEMIVNGDTGEVIAWPSDETVRRMDVVPHAAGPAAPAEPIEALRVMANIGVSADVREARAMKAEGIGLYRTELEFFAAGRVLGEGEQFERYAAVVQAMGSRPVYFRLLDIGADKPSPLFEIPFEANPSLGLRGARFLLSRPDLLRTQARALARVAQRRPVHVMYPMIVDIEQFRRLRALFDDAVAGMPKAEVHHGVMFEVPSAALEAREILREADFGSIGSNDLVQYLFAVDRNNNRVAADYSPDRAVFWRLIEHLVQTARDARRPLSICGEMAADPTYIPRLLALGIRTVSVSARHITAVRRAAREALSERGHP
jgi:phosphoenolpyruvate-protein phosphotransferase